MPADNASKPKLASIILTLEISCQFSKTHVRTNSLNAFSCLKKLLTAVWNCFIDKVFAHFKKAHIDF